MVSDIRAAMPKSAINKKKFNVSTMFLLENYINLNSQDLIVNSPIYLLHISLYISYENLMLDQGNNFYLISLSILITCLLENVWTLWRGISFKSLLGVKGLTCGSYTVLTTTRPDISSPNLMLPCAVNRMFAP